jgi:uncharacterized protein YbjT (DUF2867 family)
VYLIIGASGFLGSRVTKRLLEAGQPVRAQSRNPETKLRGPIEQGAEPVQGDLRDTGWLENAMQGVRRVLLASQAIFPPTRTNHAETVDGPGNRKVIDAAKSAGVEHFVFMSVSLADPEFPVRFLRAKYQTEEYLKSSGLDYTILRPSLFTEVHGLELFGKPLVRNETVQLFGRSKTPLRWISVEDVADRVVEAFESPDDRNVVRTIGGPDILSRLDVVELLEQHTGKQAKRRHVPLAMMRLMRTVTRPVHPGLNDVISLAIAEETMPNHPGFAPRDLDWTGPTTVEDVVRHWAGTGPSREPVAAD